MWFLARRGVASVVRCRGTRGFSVSVRCQGRVTFDLQGSFGRFAWVRVEARFLGVDFGRAIGVRRDRCNLIFVVYCRFAFLDRAREVGAVQLRCRGNGVETSECRRRQGRRVVPTDRFYGRGGADRQDVRCSQRRSHRSRRNGVFLQSVEACVRFVARVDRSGPNSAPRRRAKDGGSPTAAATVHYAKDGSFRGCGRNRVGRWRVVRPVGSEIVRCYVPIVVNCTVRRWVGDVVSFAVR